MASRWGQFFHWISTFDEKSADRDMQSSFVLDVWLENERQMMRESIHCHFNIFLTGMCKQQQLTFENWISRNFKPLNWAGGWLQAVTGKVSMAIFGKISGFQILTKSIWRWTEKSYWPDSIASTICWMAWTLFQTDFTTFFLFVISISK